MTLRRKSALKPVSVLTVDNFYRFATVNSLAIFEQIYEQKFIRRVRFSAFCSNPANAQLGRFGLCKWLARSLLAQAQQLVLFDP
jgi:hypothetical protein